MKIKNILCVILSLFIIACTFTACEEQSLLSDSENTNTSTTSRKTEISTTKDVISSLPDSSKIESESSAPIASDVTIDYLMPMIKKAVDYMLGSEEFCQNEKGVWVVWGNNVEPIPIDEYITSYKKELSNVFSKRMISSMPVQENGGFKLVSIGLLSGSRYSYGSCRGTDISFNCNNWSIESIENNVITLRNIAFYVGNPDVGAKVHFEGTTLINEENNKEYILQGEDHIEEYSYTLVFEDGQWKFDSFSLWY